MNIHHLKIEEKYLNAIKNGSKTFEIRFNDRDYQVGDILVFEDSKEESGQYAVLVTYMVDDERFCKENFVTMAIKPTKLITEVETMKYRRKPPVVEAKQLTDETYDQIVKWLKDNKCPYVQEHENISYIKIYTSKGIMIAFRNDYIIKDMYGRFYPYKPDIFEQTYEEVEE